MTTRTLSFVFLDELKPLFGPWHREVTLGANQELNIRQLHQAILEWCKEIQEQDPTCFSEMVIHNQSPFFLDRTNYHRDIALALLTDHYWCMNRFEKYYSIGLALDYTRFEVFAKDCPKQLVVWRDNDSDPVVNNVTDPNYNENPVVSLMKQLQ